MNLVLCFSGGIASGKTTLARAVSEQRGWRCASFGAYVREVALGRGVPDDRAHLQELGAALIAEMGWIAFCDAVMRSARWTAGASLVVDGIRHVAAFETIASLAAPAVAKLVFVDVGQDVRRARARSVRPDETTDLATSDAHSTEKDVHGELRGRASLVVDGTKDVSVLVGEVLSAFP